MTTDHLEHPARHAAHAHPAHDAEALALAVSRETRLAWTTRAGLWSDASIWQPRPPQVGDAAHILHDVVNDLPEGSGSMLRAVVNRGKLWHAAGRDTRLVCGSFLNMPGASYHCRPDAGRAAELILGGWPLDPVGDPGQMLGGLLSWGDCTLEGEARTPFVELAEDAAPGDEWLILTRGFFGWKPGHELALPVVGVEAEQEAGNLVEFATVADVGDYPAVRLTAPLRFHHLRGRHPETGLDLPVHVANVTRSVRVRSLDPAGVRGHVMAIGKGRPVFRNVEFRDLGRTTLDRESVIGRYSVHFHMLEWKHLLPHACGCGCGCVIPADTRERYVCEGCVIR